MRFGTVMSAAREKRSLEGAGDYDGLPRAWERDCALKPFMAMQSELRATVVATAASMLVIDKEAPHNALIVAPFPWSTLHHATLQRTGPEFKQLLLYTNHTPTAVARSAVPENWALQAGEFVVWYRDHTWFARAANAQMTTATFSGSRRFSADAFVAIGNIYVARAPDNEIWADALYTRRGAPTGDQDVYSHYMDTAKTIAFVRTPGNVGRPPVITIQGASAVAIDAALLSQIGDNGTANQNFLSALPFATAEPSVRAWCSKVWDAFLLHGKEKYATKPAYTLTSSTSASGAEHAPVLHVEHGNTSWCIGNSPVMAADCLLNVILLLLSE